MLIFGVPPSPPGRWLVARARSTEGWPPTFPGSPPGPPPRPSLWWLPALMLPALLLVGAISYTAWSAWWV